MSRQSVLDVIAVHRIAMLWSLYAGKKWFFIAQTIIKR